MSEIPAHPALADALARFDSLRNVQLSLSFGEQVDPGVVRQAWAAVALRHPVLRSAFLSAGPEGARVRVLATVEPRWEYQDWQTIAPEEIPAKWNAFREADAAVALDPAQAPCLRTAEIGLPGGGRHYLITFPEFLLDEFSIARVLVDWLRALGGEDLGDVPEIATSEPGSAAVWKELIGEDDQPLDLHVRAASGVGGEARLILSREESDAFKSYCTGRDLDPAAVLQAVWGLTLRRHGADGRLLLSRISVRGESGEAGCYETWLPASVPVSGRVRDGLRAVSENRARMAGNGRVSLSQLTKSEIPARFGFGGRDLNDVIHGALPRWINFDVRLHRASPPGPFLEVRDGFRLELTAGGGGLDEAMAAKMLERVATLLGDLPNLDEKTWDLIPVCSPEEIRRMRALSRPAEPLDLKDSTVPACFRERAVADPGRAAVFDGDYTLTFGELDSLSDRLAAHLLHAGLAGGWNVGLFLSQSSWAAIGLLGSWKAGNSVIPLDPAAPPEWIESTLASNDAAVVLCDAASAPLLDTTTRRRIVLDQEWDALETSDGALPAVTPESPAAILPGHFDSPAPALKALTHGFLAAASRSGAVALGFGPGDVFLAHSAAGGGAFLDEWLIPLVAGGAVRIADDALVDPAAGDATHVRLTAPEWANQAARWKRGDGKPGPLRVVAVEAGNPNARVLEIWENALPGATTVFWSPASLCGIGLISKAAPTAVFLPLGAAAPSCEAFVCDSDGHDVPDGFAAGLFLKFLGWKSLAEGSRRGWPAGLRAFRDAQGLLSLEGGGTVPGFAERARILEHLPSALDAHVGRHIWTLDGPSGRFSVPEWPLTRGGWVDEAALPQPEEKKVAKAVAPVATPVPSRSHSWSPLQVFREKGSARRLVLVPGAAGDPAVFSELAAAMAPHRRVIGLRSRGSADPEACHPSVEAAAAAYLTAVLEDDPAADFVLAGFGTGGTVAFEMARQMRAAGRPVPALVLMGAPAPEEDRGRDWLATMKSAVLRLTTKTPPEPAVEDSPVFFAHEQVWRKYRAVPSDFPATLIVPSDFPSEAAAGWDVLCPGLSRESMKCRWDEMLGPAGAKRLASILEAI